MHIFYGEVYRNAGTVSVGMHASLMSLNRMEMIAMSCKLAMLQLLTSGWYL